MEPRRLMQRVLCLAADDEITVIAEGDDEEAAVNGIEEFLSAK